MSTIYDQWSPDQLAQYCRDHKLDSGGNKDDLINRLLQNGITPPSEHQGPTLMLNMDGTAVGGAVLAPPPGQPPLPHAAGQHAGQRRKSSGGPRAPPPKRARAEYHDKPYSDASMASTLNKRTKSIKNMCDHVTSRARGNLSIIVTFIYKNNKYDTRVFGDLVTTDTERETRLEDYIHATFSKAANVHHGHGGHGGHLLHGLDPTKALDNHGGAPPPLDDFVIRSECSRDELLRVYRRAMRRLTKRAQPGFFDMNRKPDGFPGYLWKKPDKLSRDEVATALRWCQQQMGNGIVLPTTAPPAVRQLDPPPQMPNVPMIPPMVPQVNVPYSAAAAAAAASAAGVARQTITQPAGTILAQATAVQAAAQQQAQQQAQQVAQQQARMRK